MHDGLISYTQRLLLTACCFLILTGCSTLKSAAPWHRIILDEEFSTADLTADYQWKDYLAQEDRLFAQLHKVLADNPRTDAYRYQQDSLLNSFNHIDNNRALPNAANQHKIINNWNRSFVLKPTQMRGGIVMLHGLSDSPYTVRSLALHFQEQGFYVIAARLPGHGTLPSGLLNVQWEDWAAVTKLAMRELQMQLGENNNIYFVSYSTGAALAVDYTLNAQLDKKLPQPKKLVLLSPMFGVSKFAVLSKSVDLIGHIPLLSSERWLSKQPEYNPFKYNSFTVNAGWQARSLTRNLEEKMTMVEKSVGLKNFPPVLGFQSLMDATISTAAVEHFFAHKFQPYKNELVIFDINRHQNYLPITRSASTELFTRVFVDGNPKNYNLVRIGNTNSSSHQVSEWRRNAESSDDKEMPLSLEFPRGVFSLSHIALPFPINDPTYGLEPDEGEFYGIRLGNLNFRGERNTLALAADTNQRLNANPFYSYMEKRIDEWLEIPQPIK
ncbi:MAG: alpha/beta hydrolase [Cellvibrio sp. 79]|nr:MAG: alpha/beta hydrolase [Cellvibrio sp. 79]